MKKWKIITIATLAVVTAALLVSTVTAMGPFGLNGGYGGMMGNRYAAGGYGGGMMRYGNGPYVNPQTPTQTDSQATYPFQFGGGCIGRSGFSRYVEPNLNTGATQLTIDAAVTIAKNYITTLGNPDLTVKQIEEYANNFYIQVNEASTDKGAFELLINKQTGSIYPERGPNMMWNTKYGMMRNGIYGNPTTTATVTQAQAITAAQQYLASYLPGMTTGDVTAFYGYFTIEILNDSTPYGMLSVNDYSGQVWFHNWHGSFIAELQVS